MLRATGQPIHTRSLSLVMRRSETGRLHVRGDVIDLRKRGFMPVPGGLQPAGIIHHMHLDATVHPTSRILERLEVGQPVVAFEPSPESHGECCRDPAPRLQALVGERVDADFSRALGRAFGGPLGCSHLLTLAQLMGSAVPRALDHEDETGAFERRETGERIFQRMLAVDGLDAGEGRLELIVQLSDVHTAPATAATSPFERFSRQAELHVHARVDLERLEILALEAAERTRDRERFADVPWRDLGGRVAPFVGRSIMGGLARQVLAELGDGADVVLLRDGLLNLAPGFIQCMAATLDRWLERAVATRAASDGARARDRSGGAAEMQAAAVGGTADSCYMWRRGGALLRYRHGIPRED
jgi:hypothetical protein